MASLESLNDDCLREILEYCDTEDHIAFVEAFEQFKPVVQDIWKMCWRELHLMDLSNAIIIFFPQNGDLIEINSQRFKIVVDLMQPFVEEIDINGKNKEMLDIINASQFPKATELRLYDTSASPIVKSCFPNLRSLVLGGDSVIEYNSEWSALEHVDVRWSNMSTGEIMELISQLKLKKFTFGFKQPFPDRYRNYEYFSELEEISGPANGVKELLNALNVMHKLRKVSVGRFSPYLDTNISTLSQILGTRTVEFFIIWIYLNDLTPTDEIKYFEDRLEELPNLKRLTLKCCDIEVIQMFSRSCHLHLLKAIIFNGMNVDAAILTNILISVPQLELLEVCLTMDGTIHLDVAIIAQKRSKPVIINVVPQYYNKVEILLSAPTDLIKITNNPTAFSDDFVNFIYILEKQ